MRYELSDANKFKIVDDELLAALKENLPEESEDDKMEGFRFEYDGRDFSAVAISQDEVVSEGKYENGGTYYQLVEFNKNVKTYPCDESIVDYFDIEIFVGWYRTGSYYSDWYYSYDKPTLYKISVVKIPEQIIKAHQEVRIKEITE